MGRSMGATVEDLPEFKPRWWGMKVHYPPKMAKNTLKQSLQALAFLHNNGIVHGDFHPGNVLFTLNDINSKPEDLLQQEDVHSRSLSPEVQRLYGKEDRWAPRYHCISQPPSPFTYNTDGFS
jgi:non-specific serine/threonine protein kinase